MDRREEKFVLTKFSRIGSQGRYDAGMRFAAILLMAATGAANAGEIWLACTPIDDPVNGRRVFQTEPCPAGERHIPLPPFPTQLSLRSTYPDEPAAYSADSWPATAGGSPSGYAHTRHQRRDYARGVRRR